MEENHDFTKTPPRIEDSILENEKLTAFQKSVLLTIMRIPKGKVTTYGVIATSLEPLGNPRSVGQALKRNPYAPGCPCHRVLRSDGSLGGYKGKTSTEGSKRKVQLLRQEGISVFRDGKNGYKISDLEHHLVKHIKDPVVIIRK